jgi:hypothetical protein
VASGPFHALSVVALAASASQGSWSVSAGNAMEAANVAATFAAVQQKLNPRHCNDGPLSSTPPDESCVDPGPDCFAEREVNYVRKDVIHVKSSRNAGRTETERVRNHCAL